MYSLHLVGVYWLQSWPILLHIPCGTGFAFHVHTFCEAPHPSRGPVAQKKHTCVSFVSDTCRLHAHHK